MTEVEHAMAGLHVHQNGTQENGHSPQDEAAEDRDAEVTAALEQLASGPLSWSARKQGPCTLQAGEAGGLSASQKKKAKKKAAAARKQAETGADSAPAPLLLLLLLWVPDSPGCVAHSPAVPTAPANGHVQENGHAVHADRSAPNANGHAEASHADSPPAAAEGAKKKKSKGAWRSHRQPSSAWHPAWPSSVQRVQARRPGPARRQTPPQCPCRPCSQTATTLKGSGSRTTRGALGSDSPDKPMSACMLSCGCIAASGGGKRVQRRRSSTGSTWTWSTRSAGLQRCTGRCAAARAHKRLLHAPAAAGVCRSLAESRTAGLCWGAAAAAGSRLLETALLCWQVRKYIRTIAKPGIPMFELVETLEDRVRELIEVPGTALAPHCFSLLMLRASESTAAASSHAASTAPAAMTQGHIVRN